jgi:hypothetical protein
MLTVLKKCIIAFLAGWVLLISGFWQGQEEFSKVNPENVFVQESLDKAGATSLYKIHQYKAEKRLSQRHIFFSRFFASAWKMRNDLHFYVQPTLPEACLYIWNRGPPARLA